jgi:uncharacterized protein (TIGR00661 family)
MTQALALCRLLGDAGHEVGAVVMGRNDPQTVPNFFRRRIGAPVTFVESPTFVADDADRSVRPWMTAGRELLRLPRYARGLDRVDAVLDRVDPDVVVNFFEPMAGLYALRHGLSVPTVSVAHQFMFNHPAYRFPAGQWMKRWAARAFARLTGWGADRRIALSLYPAEDRPADGLTVMPPLLREELFDQPTGRSEPFYLVYILNSGYAREVVRWHERNPEVQLHCFWDRPDADPVEHHDDTLTFHQLDDRKFLDLMARCRGVLSTAGFESIAEAMYLGKPVQVVPVEGHFEQWCNAFDTVRAGAGLRSRDFDVTRLQDFRSDYDLDAERFRQWLREGRAAFVRLIERAARRAPILDRPIPADPASTLQAA